MTVGSTPSLRACALTLLSVLATAGGIFLLAATAIALAAGAADEVVPTPDVELA